ncbi:MAG: carbohydrate-binding domain-containing protein [Pedobacter sp.]|nr:MAG: carbohydrate-binding domain-containing protein [Pedobacter sp.]
MKNKILIIVMSVFLMACSKKNSVVSESENDSSTGSGTSLALDSTSITNGTAEGGTETAINADDLVEGSTFSSNVQITFGTTVTIVNPLENAGVSVILRGSDVDIISNLAEVQYTVSGTTANGSLKIYSDKKFRLNLNGANITNTDGPAINIQSSKRAFIVLNENTVNTLVDGSTYTTSTEDQKATLFSEGQLIFSGTGSLTVKGNYKHAIASDDYIRIRSGNINISGAVTDGIHTNDAFIADGGTIKITATSDGIEVEEGYVVINDGNFTLNTGDDGIAASYEEGDAAITPYVTINGGTINVKSTAGEGIESKSILTINRGNITTQTSDDGLNAGSAIYINGGNVYAYSTGNDAMDSNGIFTITGGKIVAIGARSPEASIDCDARTLKITGGILVGIAGSTSGPSASASTINSVVMGSGTAGQLIHIEAADGTEALTFLAPTAYTTLIYASSKLKSNTLYTVYTGGSVANGIQSNGLYLGGTYTKGTKSTSFTTSNKVTQTGGSISRG